MFSAGHALGGWFRPYAGVRGGFAVPVDHEIHSAGGLTEELVDPVRRRLPRSRRACCFYLEGGVLFAWSEDDSGTQLSEDTHFGAYGAAGLEVRFPQ